MSKINTADLIVAAKLEGFALAIESMPDYSIIKGRQNHLAEVVAILRTAAYASHHGHIPQLASAIRTFLDTIDRERH